MGVSGLEEKDEEELDSGLEHGFFAIWWAFWKEGQSYVFSRSHAFRECCIVGILCLMAQEIQNFGT